MSRAFDRPRIPKSAHKPEACHPWRLEVLETVRSGAWAREEQ
jgi:hypothetical protein